MRCARTKHLLDRYYDGTLPQTSRHRVEGHLGQCGTCRDRLERIHQVREGLSLLAEVEEPERDLWSGVQARMASTRNQSWMVPRLAFAGGAALVVVGIVFGLLFGVFLADSDGGARTTDGTYRTADESLYLQRLVSLEQEYQLLKPGALDALKQSRDGLPPELLERIEADLNELDAITERVLSSLERHGGRVKHYEIVHEHFRRKFEVLNDLGGARAMPASLAL
jgi:hypothetical protein